MILKGGCITVKYNELSEEQKKLIFSPEEREQLDEARKKDSR